MEQIEKFHESYARARIKEIGVHDLMIYQWLTEQNIFCYIYFLDGAAVSFALMSTMAYDPCGKHDRPNTLNYIFTLQNYRRKGYAYKLIQHIKSRHQFSAFCYETSAINLFDKCRCIDMHPTQRNKLFRFP